MSFSRGLSIYMRGNPSANVEVEIYDESGDLVGTLHIDLDFTGFGYVEIQGGAVNGRRLGPGAYWALAKSGGVNSRKRFMVVPSRKR